MKDNDFIAEFEIMDLNDLRNEQFIVAVSTGDRNKCKLLASTIKGPFTFVEMVETVGTMWATHQHHGKVTILTKDAESETRFLDENTTDYIEAKWQEIVVDSILLDGDETIKYTCKANTVTGEEHGETTKD